MSHQRQFRYTADRSEYLFANLPFAVMSLIEFPVMGLIIFVIVDSSLIRLVLIGALVGIMAWIMYIPMLRPFLTAHRLTDDDFQVRYGPDRFIIPRDAIEHVGLASLSSGDRPVYRAKYDPERELVNAIFARSGAVEMTLTKPREMRVRGKHVMAGSVLITVDDPASLIDALDPNGIPDVVPALEPSIVAPRLTVDPRSITGARPVDRTTRPGIALTGVTYRYGAHAVIDDLSLSIHPGEIYGFLGPNGAGKTTTIKMLVGLLRPVSGSVVIDGHDMVLDASYAKASLGYVPDRAILYDRLSGREFLDFIAQIRGIPTTTADVRVATLLDAFELAESADRPCGAYSLGMRRKLSLAAALLHQPSVLVLDEPLNGLDPHSARQLKDMLREQADTGSSVLISTHDLLAAEQICDRVGILDRGRLVIEGTPAEVAAMNGATADLETAFLRRVQETATLND